MDDTGALRRRDTTKGPPLRILSLDGGGVRGYSMLIILQELMHRTFVEIEGRAPKRNEIPKPCDHFDLIAGTGTGGLIAIMLGRLRLDLDTCKELYVRMTRRVFETDKTLMGLPLKGTMFKATKLEESIKDSVREHTIYEDEGNDALANAVPMTPDTPSSSNYPRSPGHPKRSMSQSSRYSQIGQTPVYSSNRMSFGMVRLGDPNTLLYDTRENRTKTAVTACLKGTSATTLLRSYDSRRETAPDVNCTIWQAGRATTAIQMAFKPVQIGQSTYLDEGQGKFNPSPQILDEAVQNEWPGREVGVFVSIGTGKRPSGTGHNQAEWWEGFLGGGMGDFAEARRKTIAKLEGCEDTHKFMVREYLLSRGVPLENYFRLNVEVGVGEFGMNEWNRLGEISTNTRMYLGKNEVQAYTSSAAGKLARVELNRRRHERAEMARRNEMHAAAAGGGGGGWSLQQQQQQQQQMRPMQNPMAVELPGDLDFHHSGNHHHTLHHQPSVLDQKYTVLASDPYYQQHRPSVTDQKYPVVPEDASTAAYYAPPSAMYPSQQSQQQQSWPQYPGAAVPPPLRTHSQYSPAGGGSHNRTSQYSSTTYSEASPRQSLSDHSHSQYTTPPPPPPPLVSGGGGAPPLPPKTPVNPTGGGLPYPDRDRPSPKQGSIGGGASQQHTQQIQQGQQGQQQGETTPTTRTFMNMGELARRLPYPGTVEGEEAPPPVNVKNKPNFAR